MPLNLLPTEIISEIVVRLPLVLDRLNLNAVNRKLRKAAYEWPDVIHLEVHLDDGSGFCERGRTKIDGTKLLVQGAELFEQFARFNRVKKLSMLTPDLGPATLEIHEANNEMVAFFGRTLEELETINVQIKRRFNAGILGMPHLRKLNFQLFPSEPEGWLTPEYAVAMRNSAIEKAYVVIPAVYDDFNPFLVEALPSNLRYLHMDVNEDENRTGHFCSLNALPKTLLGLRIDFDPGGLGDEDLEVQLEQVCRNDFSALTSLEKLVITFLWPWCEDHVTFIKLLEAFVATCLPSSLGVLCLSQPPWTEKQTKAENAIAIGPFDISRSEFERSFGGIAWGRKKHLTIEIGHSFKAEQLIVDVHEKLRVKFCGLCGLRDGF